MPTILERARSLLRSPADRRLDAAAREAFASAPRPVVAKPFGGGTQPPGKRPGIDWQNDQPAPAPGRYEHVPGYSDHTFKNSAAPLAFEGFSLERIRNAVALHRLGNFYESSALMVAILGFAPALAATEQAVAPIIALRRYIRGGDRGLAKLVASEIEEQLVPSSGLKPSIYFPPEAWGTMAIYFRYMGFAVLQHVDGDPDPATGVRPRFTRLWEPWATQAYRSPRKLLAMTTEGPIEICNDGHFTLVADENEPWLTGAVVALGEDVFGGRLTQELRMSFLDFFGKPKLYATLPEKVATRSDAGDDFEAAVNTIYGPDGRGVLPWGSTLDAVSLSGEGSAAFRDGLLDFIIHIFMVMTGSAGTIGNGMSSGAGPQYQPAKGGSWDVRRDLVFRPALAMVRGLNQGHVGPYTDGNYGEAIDRAKRAGAWKDPAIDVEVTDFVDDARIESLIEREKARVEIVKGLRDINAEVTQDLLDRVSSSLHLEPVKFADARPSGGEIFQYHIEGKMVAPDEVRDRLGLPPLPDGIGSVEQLARERAEGRDKTGAPAPEEPGGAQIPGEGGASAAPSPPNRASS